MKMPEKSYEEIVEQLIHLQAQGYPINNVYQAADKLWKQHLIELKRNNNNGSRFLQPIRRENP